MDIFVNTKIEVSQAVLFFIFFIISCKIQPGSDRRNEDGNPDRVYKLRLNPTTGSTYYYTITNGSEFRMEVDGKKIDKENKSTVAVSYGIDKDSVGDLLLTMVYDKIHFYSKNKDGATDLDAGNAESSQDPVEKLMSIVKGATITAVINPKGEIQSIKGYDELKSKLLASFNPNDTYSKAIAEKQWEERIKEGMIKKNVEQLFKIFPDSAVHVGDKWKLGSVQKDEMNLAIKNSYTLTGIRDGVAVIRSEGDITSDNASGSTMGYAFTADIKGKQEGEYEMETATGMLLTSKISADIEGEMSMMGRKIPITIHSTMKMEGKRMK
jgi:hypothetical protein